jgi:hypothetical protein
MEMRALLMNFESLGRNCEFGLFQRQFEAEPVGLLRWSSCGHRQLIAALQAQFEGFGTPEQSEIVRERGEYWIRDTRYDILSHTAIREVKAEPDYVAKKQYPILKFLKESLLRNLSTCEKIFVYQHKHLSDDLMSQLQAAVASYGPNLLMCVRLQDDRHPAGTVDIIDEHNMVCYLDREGTPGPSGWDISVDLWTDFCHQAYRQWEALGRGGAAA